jgi:hypothetical protein
MHSIYGVFCLTHMYRSKVSGTGRAASCMYLRRKPRSRARGKLLVTSTSTGLRCLRSPANSYERRKWPVLLSSVSILLWAYQFFVALECFPRTARQRDARNIKLCQRREKAMSLGAISVHSMEVISLNSHSALNLHFRSVSTNFSLGHYVLQPSGLKFCSGVPTIQ